MDAEEWIKDIRSGCVDKTKDVIFSSKYVSELADFIEQQAKQIIAMRSCDNCAWSLNRCEKCNDDLNKWRWDGGSGEI